jgi:hypothetical protein
VKRLRRFVPACALALVACAPAPVAAPVPPAAPAKFSCQPARAADFEGEGEQRLRAYLAWLATNHGKPAALKPSQIALAILRGEPKPGPAGVQVAEVSCNADDYRIALYRTALSGRPLAVAYETVAHEFHHVVQIRRDKLACESPKGERAAYEREATEFARKLVPRCSR